MGWNDFSGLVNLQNKAKYLFITIGFLLVAFIYQTQSDEPIKDNKVKKEEDVKFRFKVRYQNGIKQHWKYNEVTDVVRTFNDSSTLTFQRKIEYYFTIKCLDLPVDGFDKLNVVIDSINYTFNDGKKIYRFNSQSDEDGDISFEDVIANSVALSREFELTISPYGEIAKIEGEQLDYYLNYINENSSKGVDSSTVIIWKKGLSKEQLTHYVDAKKILIPPGYITLDSIWKTPFQFSVNGIDFYDTVITKIIGKKKISYLFSSESSNLRSQSQKAKLYAIGPVVNVDSSKGSGVFSLQLHSRGILEKAEADFKIQSYISYRREHFIEGINTKISWELLSQYK